MHRDGFKVLNYVVQSVSVALQHRLLVVVIGIGGVRVAPELSIGSSDNVDCECPAPSEEGARRIFNGGGMRASHTN